MEREFKKRKRDMSFRRRGDGLSVASAMNIDNGLRLVFQLLELVDAPHLPPEAKHEVLLQVFTLLNELHKEATYVKNPLPPVYNRSKGRGLNTLSDEFCYRRLRFGKNEIIELLTVLDFPRFFMLDNRVNVSFESAFLFFLYRLRYPSTLAMTQDM